MQHEPQPGQLRFVNNPYSFLGITPLWVPHALPSAPEPARPAANILHAPLNTNNAAHIAQAAAPPPPPPPPPPSNPHRIVNRFKANGSSRGFSSSNSRIPPVVAMLIPQTLSTTSPPTISNTPTTTVTNSGNRPYGSLSSSQPVDGFPATPSGPFAAPLCPPNLHNAMDHPLGVRMANERIPSVQVPLPTQQPQQQQQQQPVHGLDRAGFPTASLATLKPSVPASNIQNPMAPFTIGHSAPSTGSAVASAAAPLLPSHAIPQNGTPESAPTRNQNVVSGHNPQSPPSPANAAGTVPIHANLDSPAERAKPEQRNKIGWNQPVPRAQATEVAEQQLKSRVKAEKPAKPVKKANGKGHADEEQNGAPNGTTSDGAPCIHPNRHRWKCLRVKLGIQHMLCLDCQARWRQRKEYNASTTPIPQPNSSTAVAI